MGNLTKLIKSKLKHILPLTFIFALFGNMTEASGTILFLPQDNRPVSYQESVEVAECAGFKLITPDENILSRGPDTPGDSDALWKWLLANAKKADAAVIATDALLYGGLIPSRKHHVSERELKNRIANFSKLIKENPNLKLYLFTSLMRTPVDGDHAGVEEPEYYQKYGEYIFKYTRLLDKKETYSLTEEEKKEIKLARQNIPDNVWNDWMKRRKKNFAATLSLLELTKKRAVNVLVLGRDDNAPLSQTHLENRQIEKKAQEANLPPNCFFSLAGIDEFNTLLLARAINDLTNAAPKVYVEFAKGAGGKTIPMFSDIPIENSIEKEVAITGGKMTKDIENADVVLMVNTDIEGRTEDASNWNPKYTPLPNDGFEREGTVDFFYQVKKYVDNGYPVTIADIVFVNGSDNFLMRNLRDNNMYFKLKAYAGWNTGTNSAGSAIAMGMLAKNMPESKKNQALIHRYLDDWGYQANIRTFLYTKVFEQGDKDKLLHLNESKESFEKEATLLMRNFVKEQGLHFDAQDTFYITFPWNRLFECRIEFPRHAD